MSKNMGSVDRLVRVIIGLIAAYLAFTGTGALQWVAGIVALIMLGTSAIGSCPLYVPFGIKTCKT